MRKLSLVGGLAASLLAATSVLAAAPGPQAAAPAASHMWSASFADGSLHVTGTLTASAAYSTGSLKVHITGATKGEKITIRFFDRVGTTNHVFFTRTRTVTKAAETLTETIALTKSELATLKGLSASAHRDLRVTGGGKSATRIMTGQ